MPFLPFSIVDSGRIVMPNSLLKIYHPRVIKLAGQPGFM